LKQNCMGSPLGAAKYNSLLQGAASLDRLGTTGIYYIRFEMKLSTPSMRWLWSKYWLL